MEFLINLLQYPFMQRALICGTAISFCAALIGVILVLKKYSMIGHGLGEVGFASLSLALVLGLPEMYVAIPIVIIASFIILLITLIQYTGIEPQTLFDIISPVMIGPSSSHTAGAVRLGLLAKNIYKNTPKKVVFKLYNSYAHTGKGHGTEKGLLAGVLGLSVDDRRIKNIFESDIAKEIDYSFEYYDNFKYHPNAVEMIFDGENKMFIAGESVGAGEVAIRKIDDFNVKLTGKYNTLILVYKDMPGMISQVTSILQSKNINIASLICDRNAKGKEASMIISIDGNIDSSVVETVEEIPEVYFVSYVEKLEN